MTACVSNAQRERPAFEITDRLLRLEAVVFYHDLFIAVAPRMRTWPDLPPLRCVPLTPETLAVSDAAVIVTDRSSVDYELVLRHAPLIIDTRGVYRSSSPNVVKA